jgi:hypothetical protein
MLMLSGCVASVGPDYSYYPPVEPYYAPVRPYYYPPRPVVVVPAPRYQRPYRSHYNNGYRHDNDAGYRRQNAYNGNYGQGGGQSRGRRR